MNNYSSVIFLVLPIAFYVTLTYPDALPVPPNKDNVKAPLIGCIDVDECGGMKRFVKILVRFVANELEVWSGLHLIWKYDDYSQVRRALLPWNVMCNVFYAQPAYGAPSYLNHLSIECFSVLVQLTKCCLNRLRVVLTPAKDTTGWEKKAGEYAFRKYFHYGSSCFLSQVALRHA